MRILVTGGAGYIGSHAVRFFLARGHDVWVYDNLSMGHRGAVPAERLIVGDLAETDRLDHVLLARRIEAVVHYAAFAYVGESVTDPGNTTATMSSTPSCCSNDSAGTAFHGLSFRAPGRPTVCPSACRSPRTLRKIPSTRTVIRN
jgi:hypothetical protein